MLTVTFLGKTAITTPGAEVGLSIWSYRVEPTSPGELPAGQRVAIGLPSGVDVRSPALFPGVPQLQGGFLQRDAGLSRQYAGRQISTTGSQVISFVAPAYETSYEVLLAKSSPGQDLASVPFITGPGGTAHTVQLLPAPMTAPAVFNGRPLTDFTGSLPYASELFGVYKPLAGWFGRANTLRMGSAIGIDDELSDGEVFSGAAARDLTNNALTRVRDLVADEAQGVLSPVGLVNLFRQYFFEFDTFLGTPVGHLWISPGGTVEVVESSTRKTVVEKTTELFDESTLRTEESLTTQEDLADAVKEDNANDTKLGASASGGANFAGIYHADASVSFSAGSSVKRSSEETHKHSRNQSAKVTSEIRRNFKTTFKTVTESTDTTSRRYVVQNTTTKLVNYELRRKMRKVGVQVQHIGTNLSWQAFMNDPGKELGLGELIHVVPAPDLTSIRKPDAPPPLVVKNAQFTGAFPIRKKPGTQDPPEVNMEFVHHSPPDADGITSHDNSKHIVARMDYTPSPPEQGYKLQDVRFLSAAPGRGFVPHLIRVNPEKTGFAVFPIFVNTGDLSPIALNFDLTWDPPATNDAHERYAAEKKLYDAEVAELQRTAYAKAVRDRAKLVRGIPQRRSEDLRREERHTVYGYLIRKLKLFDDAHLGAELLRQIFDVDEMLYFVAPEYWRPGNLPPLGETSKGRYPAPKPASAADIAADHLAGTIVTSSYSHTSKNNALVLDVTSQNLVLRDEWRINYPIAEDGLPAPLGSSLGWLIQIDGDERRNQFLNAAWVKAVLPIRPGHELEALEWLKQANVEGEAGLGLPYPFQAGDPPEYQGKTVGQVLELLAAELKAASADFKNTLAVEKVFEKGFDPLEGGFRPAGPYEVFDQWREVLPTDQVVAVEVEYDPKTGQQP
ncbi:hypothetical protein [Sphaerisporangium perillae]|uniref:hypothetical protein n=1 Tax=Sphaerisporangium perillae TaxID=2935860 RepID=UPI00200D906D|nr:hypothetical protein [Sphaerisporangium perillae]